MSEQTPTEKLDRLFEAGSNPARSILQSPRAKGIALCLHESNQEAIFLGAPRPKSESHSKVHCVLKFFI